MVIPPLLAELACLLWGDWSCSYALLLAYHFTFNGYSLFNLPTIKVINMELIIGKLKGVLTSQHCFSIVESSC